MNTKLIKGIIFVAIGAASYGVLATFVKLGGREGFSTAELTFSQAVVGLLVLIVMNLISDKTNKVQAKRKPTNKEKLKLAFGGISLGLTSSFYYLSLNYVEVSICIVMLMQSVWMGSVLDYFLNGTKPSKNKIIAIIIVLFGTVLATNILISEVTLDWRGILWGFLAAISYTLGLFASNNIATGYPPVVRSMYLLVGAVCIVTVIWGHSIYQHFDFNVFWKWGIILAFFGTILPPLLFTKGMPIVGMGLGSIVASVELPVSVLMAYFLLNETVNLYQWIGIILILVAIVVMNYSLLKPQKG